MRRRAFLAGLTITPTVAAKAQSISIGVGIDELRKGRLSSGGGSTTTWDPATVTAVTLSGGNLVATNTGSTSADQGAHVASANGKSSGKYYFEASLTQGASGGNNTGIAIGTTSSTYTTMGGSATTGVELYNSGNVWSNTVNLGISLVAFGIGTTLIGVAVDLDNRKIWFRKGASGNWNANATYDPASNVGGATVPAGTMVPFCTFGGPGGGPNNFWTANFGASAFTGAVPSGYISGWI